MPTGLAKFPRVEGPLTQGGISYFPINFSDYIVYLLSLFCTSSGTQSGLQFFDSLQEG